MRARLRAALAPGRRGFAAGAVITGVMTLLIVAGAFWTPYDPYAMDASVIKAAPSLTHLLGTDEFGRDIFSRIIKGAGTTLFIAAATVAAGAVLGIAIGGLTGYFGGVPDALLMRFNDTLAAFPSMLLALALISLLGPGEKNVIVCLGILFIPGFARVSRSEFSRCRSLDYVSSARIMGAGHLRIMLRHILPNTAPVLTSAVAIGFNNAVLAEASMSYLGIGVQPPRASLGYMLSEAQSSLFTAPWYALSAGAAIVLLILGFSLLGGERRGLR